MLTPYVRRLLCVYAQRVLPIFSFSFDIEIIEKFDEFHILHEHKKNQNPNAVSSVDPFLLRRHWVRVG